MIISENGLAVIKNFEGLRLNAYKDIAGVWTIGYGSTRYYDSKSVKPGDKLANAEQATVLFRVTLKRYVDAVNDLVKKPLTQNQFDALVSLAYNIGTGGLQQSTALRKLNAGDYQGAADAMLSWNKITDPATGNKVVSATLKARREAERKLFLKDFTPKK